jgi:hypothetical protein
MVLVVDFGTTFTKATLLVPGLPDPLLVTDPLNGHREWPSVVYAGESGVEVGKSADARRERQPKRTFIEFKRHLGDGRLFGVDGAGYPAWRLVTMMLTAVRERAQQLVTEPVDRLLITCPADFRIGVHEDTRWADLDRACRTAGFLDIEYLYEPVAAAYAPVAEGPLSGGDVVLVYDWGGGTFDAAITHIAPRQHEVLAAGSVPFCGGADIDALLMAEIGTVTGDGSEAGSARFTERRRSQAQQTKEHLSVSDSWPVSSLRDDEDDEERELHLGRDRLEELVTRTGTGLVDKTLALIAELAAEVAPVKPKTVLIVGGTTRMPVVATRLHSLGYQVRRPVSLDYAVIDGAVAWARLGVYRACGPEDLFLDRIPLRWPIPGDDATLSSWLAKPGDRIHPGDTLARVTLPGGALWDLKSSRHGVLESQHYQKDDRVHPADWIATLRPLAPGSTSTPIFPRIWREIPGRSTIAALSSDGRHVATAKGTLVNVYDLVDWANVGTATVSHEVEQLVFTPAGELIASYNGCFAAWDKATMARRWDFASANAIARRSGHTQARIAPSPDGRHLVISWLSSPSYEDPSIVCLSARDRSVLHTVPMKKGTETCVAGMYSSDGKTLIPAVTRTGPQVIDAAWDGGPRIVGLPASRAVAIQPGCNRIYRSAGESSILNHDIGQAPTAVPTGAGQGVVTLAFNPAGTLLAAGLANGFVELSRRGDNFQAPVATIRTGASCNFAAFTPDGYHLITLNAQALSIWSLADTVPPLAKPGERDKALP